MKTFLFKHADAIIAVAVGICTGAVVAVAVHFIVKFW